jgi:hypothetical protein
VRDIRSGAFRLSVCDSSRLVERGYRGGLSRFRWLLSTEDKNWGSAGPKPGMFSVWTAGQPLALMAETNAELECLLS